MHLALGQPGHGFVKQQDLRFGREGPGDFKPLAAGRAQRTRRLIGKPAHADAFEHGACPRFGFAAMGRAKEGADHHILQHRHTLEGLRHLEGAGESQLRARLR